MCFSGQVTSLNPWCECLMGFPSSLLVPITHSTLGGQVCCSCMHPFTPSLSNNPPYFHLPTQCCMNSNSTIMAATFHSFSKLPTELRIKIWNFALPLFGRIFELNNTNFGLSLRYLHSPNNPGMLPYWQLKVDRVPALLLVNHEAREELLPKYAVSLSHVNGPGIYANLRFCPEVDIDTSMTIPDDETLLEVFQEVFSNDYAAFKQTMRYLAGSHTFWVSYWRAKSACAIAEMNNLNALIMVGKGKGTLFEAGCGKVVGLKNVQPDQVVHRHHLGWRESKALGEQMQAETGVEVIHNKATMCDLDISFLSLPPPRDCLWPCTT